MSERSHMTSSDDSINFPLRNSLSVKLHSNYKYVLFKMCSLGIYVCYWS
jgi:hypothetical protein